MRSLSIFSNSPKFFTVKKISNPNISENKRVAKAAGIVSAATVLSRIFGFIRDMVIAWFFGAGLSADAFFVAFRIPNLLRRLFAEGSLSIAFIPVFTEYYKNDGKAAAFKLAKAATWLLSILLAVLSIIGILLAPLIIRLIAPGFSDSPEKLALTVILTRIMFPYIFFIGMTALFMGILNVMGHFAAPALAPVFLNIAMIFSVFFFAPYMSNPVTGLAIGVIAGGMLQLGLQIPFLMKKGFYFWNKIILYHPGIKKIGILMIPSIFGAAVYQINILVGTLLASLLSEGSVSYLYYADRLVQFPLAVFGIATATAVLPSLSRQAAAKNFDELKKTFAYALNLVLFITIPSMAGLIVLREPIIALLFKRGAFNADAVQLTACALLYYTAGLWAFAAVRIVVPTFYALQDTVTPAKTAVISIFANIILGIILMQFLGHGGLALSTSLASIINLLLLIIIMRKKIGAIDWQNIARSTYKTVFCSVLMGSAVWGMAIFLNLFENIPVFNLAWKVAVCILTGLIIYAFLSIFMKSHELTSLIKLFTAKVKK